MFYGNMGDYDKATAELFPVAAYLLFTPDIHLQMKFTQVSDLLVFNTNVPFLLGFITKTQIIPKPYFHTMFTVMQFHHIYYGKYKTQVTVYCFTNTETTQNNDLCFVS